MTDLWRDPFDNNDLGLTSLNQIRLTNNAEPSEEVAQRIRSRLQRFAGEWFADRSKGVPYRRDVLIKNFDLEVIRSLFRKTIEEDPAIDRVTKMDLIHEAETRKLRVIFEAVLLQAGGGTATGAADAGPTVPTDNFLTDEIGIFLTDEPGESLIEG